MHPPSSNSRTLARSTLGLTLIELTVVVAIVSVLTGLVLVYISPDSMEIGGAPGNRTPLGITTQETMTSIREAIFGSARQAGYWRDMGRDLDYWPRYLQWLELKPSAADIYGTALGSYAYATQMLTHTASAKLGWRGPYFQGMTAPIPASVPNSLGGGSLTSPVDAWGNPILMVPPSSVLSTWKNQFSPAASNAASNRWILTNCRLVSAGPNRRYDSITNISDYQAYSANPSLAGDDIILWLRE